MSRNKLWEDYKSPDPAVKILSDGEETMKECPLCGDRGYTVEEFGDCIEHQGCLCGGNLKPGDHTDNNSKERKKIR